MPLLVRIWGRLRGQHDIDSAYSLGRWGMIFNVVGTLYLLFGVITFNFPSVSPVTADNMNYTSPAVGVSILIATLTWFTTGRRQYTGPQRGGILNAKAAQDKIPRTAEEIGIVTSKRN
jgi:choline transport protein